ncbi:MAG: hypothetical protein WBW54_18060, partial [Candidatus Acidiferrales bacterium]
SAFATVTGTARLGAVSAVRVVQAERTSDIASKAIGAAAGTDVLFVGRRIMIRVGRLDLIRLVGVRA